MEILFQDPSIVVVDKAAGEIVHPAPGHETGALTETLVRRFPEMARVGSVERPGVVHRLDIETSGVLVFARTQEAYLDLRRAFESHREVEKTYLAICHWKKGVPSKGTIDFPIEHLAARSRYEVLGRLGALALVRFDIETGRTHQIRIHAAKALSCPIVGDALYGHRAEDKRLKSSRLFLHAVELSFPHPITHRRMTFVSPPPRAFAFC